MWVNALDSIPNTGKMDDLLKPVSQPELWSLGDLGKIVLLEMKIYLKKREWENF